MLKSYFLNAYRSLVRNKEYSLINILGLAVSIASCLLLFYTLRYELSFDNFHANKKRIFRVVIETHYPDGVDHDEGIPAPLPEAMRSDFPQLEQVGTLYSIPNSQVDVIGEQGATVKYREERGVFFAEPEFFRVFNFAWLHGSPEESLTEPNTVVLTRQMAEKYFGRWENAIGKSIQYSLESTLKVTGILENIPANSDFPLKVVISFKSRTDNGSWGSVTNRRQCFVLLDEHNSAEEVLELMPAFEKKYRPDQTGNVDHYKLQPLEDVHFNPRYGNFIGRTISKPTLLGLAVIGLFLMITASINFVNLAIAQVIRKSKEVGLRRVLGSSRGQLSLQFYGETFLLLLIASCIAVVFAELAMPTLRPFLNLPENFNPVTPLETILFLLAISLIITALSGFYPARVMTGLMPVEALKSKISNQKVGGMSLRKGLVVTQFVISQLLVIVTLVVLQQLNFFRQAPLGFDKDSILFFSVPSDSASQEKLESLRNTVLQLSGTEGMSLCFTAPLSGSNRTASFQFNRSQEDAPFEVNLKYADVDYFKTYNLTLAAGRIYQSSDTAREFVVNQTFLEKFGITDAEEGLGKVITLNGVTLPIVGVLQDFHLRSLQRKIEPLIVMCKKSEYRNAGIKINPKNVTESIREIEKIYASFFPTHIFEYRFLDENVARQYASEERLSSLTNIFSAIAIFISCLGLYGLISFMAVQRTKEVGVRKVLGATVTDILALFYKEFAILVVIAFGFSAPVGWYYMSGWLNGFAYRIDLGPWTFIVAITLSLVITLVTVSFQSIKAAIANPVESLRNE